MKTDQNIFFRQASLHIFSSLDIAKAMGRVLEYLNTIFPVSQINLGLYDPETATAKVIVSVERKSQGFKEYVIKIPHDKLYLLDIKWASDQRVHILNSPDELIRMTRGGEDAPPGTSHLLMPMRIEGERIGSVFLLAPSGCSYSQEEALLLDLLHDPFAIAMSNVLRHQEILHYKEKIEEENSYLNREVRRLSSEGGIIGLDSGMKEVKKMIGQVAPMNTPVLLTGETGTGKEVVAGAIQRLSGRSDGPFIKVNCGAIPETLVDSELFGHEKGAFTGAATRKIGKFERAHRGTIFLDEVGELPLDIQVKLLRCIQQKEIERVGGVETISLDIRIIAATHRDLETMVAEGSFREDLYYRLNVFPVNIPPLRDRKEDIPALADQLIREKSKELLVRPVPTIAPGAMDRLCSYRWPGNIRELANLIERSLIRNRKGPLTFLELIPDKTKSIKEAGPSVPESIPTLEELTLLHIQRVLNLTGGKIKGPGGAAELLDINPYTLRSRMDKLGIAYGRSAQKK